MEPNAFPYIDDSLGAAREAAVELLAERDPKRSLPQPFYTDERFFRLDMEAVFEREWLFAGMTCEMPTTGSYMTLQVGDNPVVIVRARDGELRAFHNVCRHRGSRICTREHGKAARLVCPYHQWTYELDGRLLFAGHDMGEGFNLDAHGLQPVHLKSAAGFVFICLAEEPPALDEFLESLDDYLAPNGMDNVKVAAESSIVEAANWKLVIENNRECYHCNASHPELLNSLLEFDDSDDPRATPAYRELVARRQQEWDSRGVRWALRRLGHGRNRITRTPLIDGRVSMTLDGRPGCRRLMGNLTHPDMGSLRVLHLPNSWNHILGDHAIVFRVMPLSARETMVTTKWLVHRDAVEGVDYDVTDLKRVWEATNDQDRRLAEENQRGINSRAYRPGPYSETFEFGVIEFLNWYGERMLAGLGERQARLRVADG